MSAPTLSGPSPAAVPRATRRTDFATTSYLRIPAHRRRAPRTFSHSPDPHAVPTTGTTTPDLGDPTALCCAVAHAATEILRGIRPLSQLVRSVSPEVYDQLHARSQVRAAARARSGPGTTQARSRVRHARVVRISPGVAEASVVIDDADRVRAAAIRVEEHRGRWRVVVLELG